MKEEHLGNIRYGFNEETKDFTLDVNVGQQVKDVDTAIGVVASMMLLMLLKRTNDRVGFLASLLKMAEGMEYVPITKAEYECGRDPLKN